MPDTNHTRRSVAALVGTAVAVSLAGCSTLPGSDSDDAMDDDGMSDETTTEDAMDDDSMSDETTTEDGMGDDG